MPTFQTIHFTGVGSPVVPITTTATVQRALSATGPWTTVGQISITAQEGFFYDNTVPFDTPVWYRTLWGPNNANTGATIGPFTLAATGTVVISDPLRPWADIEFTFCDNQSSLISAACTPGGPEFIWARFGEETWRADAGLFDILNSERPADIFARRKNHEGTGRFLTRSLAAADRIYELFTAGGPLHLRAPDVYGAGDFSFQPGDVRKAYLSERIDQRLPYRIWEYGYVVVDTPVGPQQGTACANWCAVKEAFPTFADLTATGDTYADLAEGTTVC